jgi:hypothetical protein
MGDVSTQSLRAPQAHYAPCIESTALTRFAYRGRGDLRIASQPTQPKRLADPIDFARGSKARSRPSPKMGGKYAISDATCYFPCRCGNCHRAGEVSPAWCRKIGHGAVLETYCAVLRSIANSAAAGPRDGAVRLKIAKTARRTAQNMKEWRRRRLA